MRRLIYLLALWAPITSAQCDVEITNFNWETYTATIDIDCDEGVSDLCLYLGNTNLDDIPPCGNFSQNINWPEYTFTFFNNINVTQGTIELNIFDAWNNAIANPYTIAECWVQLYENGFTCEGGEIGIWQINIGGVIEDASYITFDGLCPCDPVYIELPNDTITEIEYIVITDTITEYITETIIEYDTVTLTETEYVDVIIDNYIYVTDTLTLTEYILSTEYIDCETGEPCEDGPGIDVCDDNSIFIPNTFTPNNDGVNDVFYAVTDATCWLNWKLQIYNRWGTLVKEMKDPLDYWTGVSYSGHWLCPDGVYTWKLDATQPGTAIQLNGLVTIFR